MLDIFLYENVTGKVAVVPAEEEEEEVVVVVVVGMLRYDDGGKGEVDVSSQSFFDRTIRFDLANGR